MEVQNTGGDVDSLILVNRKSLVIENSTFENLSSKYGGVINFKGDYLSVKNSTFRNTHAMTGGAILAKFFAVFLNPYDPSSGVKTRGDMVIDGCEFVNVSSVHNGGAIYFDLDSGSQGYKKTLHISNSNFTDCSSAYGGIIADQGGILNISNSNFLNSKANSLGGAIYSSWANLILNNSNLINNSAGSNAGQFIFLKRFETERCEFCLIYYFLKIK